MKHEILAIFEQIDNLTEEVRNRILLHSNLTDGDFFRLKIDLHDFEPLPSTIECHACGEEITL